MPVSTASQATLESAAAVVIGPDYLDSFASNIAAGLRSWGIDTVVVDPNAGFAGSGIDAYNRKFGLVMQEMVRRVPPARQVLVDRPMDRALRRCDPTLVLCIWSGCTPAEVERWRKYTPRATWVFWYPDPPSNLGAHRFFLADFDHFFFKEPDLVEKLAARTRLRVHMLADACNPDHHRSEIPTNDDERRRYACDVAIAGNVYPYRLLTLAGVPKDVELRLYGNPATSMPKGFARIEQARAGEYVAGRTKALAFGGAKIVLNTMHYGEIRGVNTRLFEGAGCGGFVLTHTGPDLAEYFHPGTEVATFNTMDELSDAIHYYLAADDERTAIASAGQARAHRDHTYHARLSQLLRVVGLGELLLSPSET